MYEDDVESQLKAREAYSFASKLFGWQTINCMSSDGRLSAEEIGKKIFEIVKNYI